MSFTESPYIGHKGTEYVLTSENENKLTFQSDVAEVVGNKEESLFCQII